jgi:hypothetical protein
MVRAKAHWQAEYESWRQRCLEDLDVVYASADGLYVKAGLEATAAKRFKRVNNACALISKLLCVAQKTFRKLN